MRIGANKTAVSVRVLDFGCARCNILEVIARAVLAELGVDVAIEHMTDFIQIAAYGVMTTLALMVRGRVVSCGCVPGQAELWEIFRETLERETLEQGLAV